MASSALKYVTLDVFTRSRFAGNPLAVVTVPQSATLGQEQKQIIAREFNFSETVFLHERPTPGDPWTIDIFLTNAEIPFAGHPTIGTACFVMGAMAGIAHQGSEQCHQIVTGAFITKAGKIDLQYNVLQRRARALIPHDVHIHKESFYKERLSALQPGLLSPPDLCPIVSIVKGLAFVLVNLPSTEVLEKISTTGTSAQAALDEGWNPSLLASYFYVRLADSEDGTVNLRTRMIEALLEDPATGSAASALACYLSLQERKPGTTTKYTIIQGVEMGRESEIGIEVSLGKDGEIMSVGLEGSAIQVMDGTIFY